MDGARKSGRRRTLPVGCSGALSVVSFGAIKSGWSTFARKAFGTLHVTQRVRHVDDQVCWRTAAVWVLSSCCGLFVAFPVYVPSTVQGGLGHGDTYFVMLHCTDGCAHADGSLSDLYL